MFKQEFKDFIMVCVFILFLCIAYDLADRATWDTDHCRDKPGTCK